MHEAESGAPPSGAIQYRQDPTDKSVWGINTCAVWGNRKLEKHGTIRKILILSKSALMLPMSSSLVVMVVVIVVLVLVIIVVVSEN